jgi:hypothetical protein
MQDSQTIKDPGAVAISDLFLQVVRCTFDVYISTPALDENIIMEREY